MSTDPRPAEERYCPTCEKKFAMVRRCPDDGTELVLLTASRDSMLGRSLNERFTIETRLGAGGMGTVYRGQQHSVGRPVAIKVVNPRLVNDEESIKRFLREAKLASRLNHPHAVSILDFGQTDDGLFFLVMELLSGRSLDVVLRDEVRLPLDQVVEIATQVCEALEAAHKQEIVHRDLKPANVMLLEGERTFVKVLDFGLAKSLSANTTKVTVTTSGALLGTPAFMSPEAALGRPVDLRCDLYSLGVMLYALASGTMPFVSDNVHEMLAMHTTETAPSPPGVPAVVAEVILRMMEKEPRDRYASAGEAKRALVAAAARAKEAAATRGSDTQLQELPPAKVPVNAMTMLSSIDGEPTSIYEPEFVRAANGPPHPAAPSSANWEVPAHEIASSIAPLPPAPSLPAHAAMAAWTPVRQPAPARTELVLPKKNRWGWWLAAGFAAALVGAIAIGVVTTKAPTTSSAGKTPVDAVKTPIDARSVGGTISVEPTPPTEATVNSAGSAVTTVDAGVAQAKTVDAGVEVGSSSSAITPPPSTPKPTKPHRPKPKAPW